MTFESIFSPDDSNSILNGLDKPKLCLNFVPILYLGNYFIQLDLSLTNEKF